METDKQWLEENYRKLTAVLKQAVWKTFRYSFPELVADTIADNWEKACLRIPNTVEEYSGQRFAYLTNCIKNQCYQQLRNRWKDPINLVEKEDEADLLEQLAVDIRQPEFDPFALTENVRSVIDLLPVEASHLVYGYLDHNNNLAAFAATRNMPESTLRTQVRVALAQLKVKLIDAGLSEVA